MIEEQKQRIEELEHLLEVGKAHKKLCVDKCKRLNVALAELDALISAAAPAVSWKSAEIITKARAGE